MTFDLRLVAYTPNGARLGPLPHPLGLEVAWPLDDVPALKLAYSGRAVGAELLASPVEVAVEWQVDGGPWTEAPDSRFLRIARRGDEADRAELVRYEMPGYGWMLRKCVLYPPADLGTLVEGKRPFYSATPGTIVKTLLDEGHARGALPGMTYDFTTTVDSSGAAWDKVLTIYYEPGLDALTILINLAEQGVCDFRMNGRTLQVFNADTELGRDLASGPGPVDLWLGRDVTAAPDQGTWEDAASAVLVVGDGGFRQGFTNPAAVKPWGRWELYIGQGGVSDVGTATLLADAALTRAHNERKQHTREITLGAARWYPHAHYRAGDRVLAPADQGVMESLRVRQVTLTRDRTGVISGNVVLNDRILERSIRLARRTAGIVGGSTAAGGSGARPAPPTPTPRTPAAPAGLIVDPVAYIDEHGYARGQVTATWGTVTADVNGAAIDVGGYELFMRVNVVGAPWFLVATTDAGDESTTYSPLVVGQEYAFKVRAVNLGVSGPFSAQVAVTVPDDVDPPPVPTAPAVSTRLGVIHVAWDGLGVGAAPMPSDLDRVLVWMQDPLAPGAATVGYLQSAGSIVVPGQPYGQDREFWLTAHDRSGNSSAPSASSTIAPQALVDTDVIGEVLDGSHIIDGTVVASDKVTANTITGGLIQALAIATGHIQANAITTDRIAAGQIVASHIGANQVTADKLQAVLTLATRIVAGDPAAARVELNSAGLVAVNGSGVQTVSVDAATGAVSIIGSLATGVTGNRIIVNPAGATQPEIRFMPGTGTNYSRMYSDGSMYPGEATMVTRSGVNGANTAQCQVIVAATDYRVNIVNPTSGLAAGGYLFAKPTELEVGYNDASANLVRWRFTSASAQLAGKVSWSGSTPALLMMSFTANTGSGYVVAWGQVLASVPFIVATSDYDGSNNTSIRNRTTSNFGLGVTAGVNGVAVTVSIWAWRM
ncbi:hypothetical protein ACWEN6_13495 [Sphaerisporangium sp. NPDC004334]